jgi:transposase
MTEGYGIPIGSSCAQGSPQEVSLVSFPLHLSAFTRKQLYRRLQQAYASGALQLVKRLHPLLALAQGQSVSDVAARRSRGEQTVRDDRKQSLFKGLARVVDQAPPGRPRQRTKTQRQQLAEWITARPQEAGSPAGGWNTPMVQARIQRHFGVAYHPPSSATFLKHRGLA